MGPKIELLIHGIAHGQKYWSSSEVDPTAFQGFYHDYQYPSQLLVEMRNISSVTWYYYSFLIGNMMDVDGRPGGYLGITIRINQFYSDFNNLYNILDAAFRKYIVGYVVEKSPNGFRFCKPTFDSFSEWLSGLEKQLVSYLYSFSDNSDFVSGLSKLGSANECFVHPTDTISEDCTRLFKQSGKVWVSNYCATKQENSFKQENDRLLKEVKCAEKDLENERRNSNRLSDEIRNKEQEIDSLHSTERTLKQAKDKADADYKKLQTQYSQKVCECSDLQKTNNGLKDKHNHLKEDFDKSQHDLQVLSMQYDGLCVKYKGLKVKNAALVSELKDAQLKLDRYINDEQSLQEEVERLKIALKHLHSGMENQLASTQQLTNVEPNSMQSESAMLSIEGESVQNEEAGWEQNGVRLSMKEKIRRKMKKNK